MAQVNSASATSKERNLPRFTVMQFLNLCIGAIGLQFAWSMQINLTGSVTEPLGATPLILGLIWLAGPITGIIVQPIIGAISDNMWTPFGRRRPFLLVGAILGSLALIFMPYSSQLWMAASFLWIIDACVNISQGPHRALVPDNVPQEQQAVANAWFSFAFGLGAVIAFGFPWVLKNLINVQVGIKEQFLVAAIALTVAMFWTCFTTPENNKPEPSEIVKDNSPFEPIKMFGLSAVISAIILVPIVLTGIFGLGKINFNSADYIQKLLSYFVLLLSFPMLGMALKSIYTKEIGKICAMHYFTWFGIMCMFIYFSNYVLHNIYLVPDLSSASEGVRNAYEATKTEATNLSGLAYAIFNTVCVALSIPLGLICKRYQKKTVHSVAMALMGLSFFGLAFVAKETWHVLLYMGIAGIGWASTLSIPFALFMDNIKKGTEGSSLGKFNLFVAGPQILSSILVGLLITNSKIELSTGTTNHWEYAFIVAGGALLLSALIALTLKKEISFENSGFPQSKNGKKLEAKEQALTSV